MSRAPTEVPEVATTPNTPALRDTPDPLAGVGRVLVVGFARTGQAVARVLAARGIAICAVDDRPSPEARAEAARLRVELSETPDDLALAGLLGDADLVVASPGVPLSHPALAAAPIDRLVSEVELASRLSPVPLVAVTGTNGKTTVTSLVSAMLNASGCVAPPAGNIGDPLIEAVLQPGLDCVVAEVSSFQLALTTSFRPEVGTYLNLAADHLDWHGELAAYARAKARIWAAQEPGDLAVANAEDSEVMAAAARARARVVTFGLESGDYRPSRGRLVGPGGELAAIAELPRGLPHDLLNALAALATALGAGAEPDAARQALRDAPLLPHRVALVAEAGGIAYYDDSKATTPSAVAAALAGFDSVVLLAGGRNKRLDLSPLREAAEQGGRRRVRAVVALGESADEVASAFGPGYEVARATSMREAVSLARALAEPGDTVLLSPG
ncbi:MAG: UDP-N-acetylmuramoylalanine--D-glutamate ligase, partial [Acidimicrobiaceae bacterium]|nr:UDP-N-acetylmuramoylalanine--D-glutamate ligase [Acidimicrobiaceae bacterium]